MCTRQERSGNQKQDKVKKTGEIKTRLRLRAKLQSLGQTLDNSTTDFELVGG